MEEVNKIIQQVKRNGEYLVTGQEKLILKTETLNTINTQVLSSLHTDHILNHHYLSEILKKTLKLKLLHSANVSDLRQSIDISSFHNLIYLELININIEWLLGLNYDKLECLIINGPVTTLATLLKRKWPHLQNLVLRGGRLDSLDECLMLTPRLAYLEVSRNLLTEIDNIEKLQCLECLNLSINRLTAVPVLSDFAARNLTVLVLSYNCISNITGLSKLTNLKVLDLSNNMIVHHESLSPVGDMAFLRYLNVENNPLAYVENHRDVTCGYLHENAAVEIFELDNKLLSKSEKKCVGQSSRTLDLSFLHYMPPTSAKATKIRSPIIEDCVWREKSYVPSPVQKINLNRDTSKSEHLNTKKQIENVREMYGENNWLHSHAGSYVQGILGIKQQSEREPLILPNAEVENTQDNCKPLTDADDMTETIVDDSMLNVTSDSIANNDFSGLNPFEDVDTSKTSSIDKVSLLTDDNDDRLKQSETIWRAQIVNRNKEEPLNILLCLTEKELKERSCIDGRLFTSWSRDSIESCVKICFDPIKIQINFMTVRRDKNQRIYIMNNEDANAFVNLICVELESRTLSEMNQSVFKCMKCTTMFCQESNRSVFRDKRKNRCPSCNSSIVVQVEDEPLPSTSYAPEETTQEAETNLTDDENYLDGTPMNSRSGSEEPEQRKLSRNDSDVEIISNPSEKSVEVLEVISSTNISTDCKTDKIQLPPDVRTALTESSSSGSMTDSVCTAYESRKLQTTSSSASKDTLSNSDLKVPSLLEKPIQFSFDDFACIDQRLKSYVQQKFFRNREEVVLVFHCNCVMMNPDQKFDGCIVISNRSLYIFKFIGRPEELLQKISSHRLSLVKTIATLPWNVGLIICVGQPDADIKYTFVLYVPHITIRLIAFLERIKPFEQREVLVLSPNTNCYLYVNNLLYKSELHLPIIHVAICESATIVSDNGLVEIIDLPGVVVTEYELVILAGECSWLFPYEESFPTISHVQLMNKLSHIEKNEDKLSFNFDDDVSWLLTFNRVDVDKVTEEVIKVLSSAKQKLNLSTTQTDVDTTLNRST
ncbi:uncharacterized protein LOC126847486 isoform X2 [Adelges cooleyi]|nr:uncharacterized protein LOC126847486 isoform X2 [Adelges cooleyi]